MRQPHAQSVVNGITNFPKKLIPGIVSDLPIYFVEPKPHNDHIPLRDNKHLIVIVA